MKASLAGVQRVLVLGGSGFIGQNLIAHVLQMGVAVHSVDVRAGALKHPNLVETLADISELDFAPLLPQVQAVVYLTSTVLPESSNQKPLFDIQTNLMPLVRLLEALRAHPTHRVVFASSGGTVYGHSSDSAISENFPTEPKCAYGITKLAGEKYLHLYRTLYGLPAISLRISNPYGPGQDPAKPQGVVGVFLDRIRQGTPIRIWGDGSVVRDFVWIGDVCSAITQALTYNGPHDVFNIGSGRGTSLNHLIQLLAQQLNTPAQVEYLPARRLDVAKNVLNIDRAADSLQWRPETTLKQGLTQLLANSAHPQQGNTP